MMRIGFTERPAEESWVLRGGFVAPCAGELRPSPKKEPFNEDSTCLSGENQMNCPQGKTKVIRSKSSRAILLLAAGAAVAGIGMAGCGKSQAETTASSPPSLPVSVVKVRQSN